MNGWDRPANLVGDWDGGGIRYPAVITDGGTYKMWYVGTDLYGVGRIGYATSPDGVTWTKSISNPVLDVGAQGEWDAEQLESPFVIKESPASYKMWYSGHDADGIWHIGYATSSDGINWVKHPSNPVLDSGQDNWNNVYVHGPSILYEDSLYKMWLHTVGDDGSGPTPYMAYATSTNGITWTLAITNPLFSRDPAHYWESDWVWGASVLHGGSDYQMWYSGAGGGEGHTGYATAPDETTWTKYNGASDPVLSGTGGEWDEGSAVDSYVLYEGGIYMMYYDNNFKSIGVATSTNGITWTKSTSNPVLSSESTERLCYYSVSEDRIPDFTGELLIDGVDGNSLGTMLGFVIADLNNDGLDDLIYSGPIFPFMDIGVPVRILMNDGAGNYVDGTSTMITGTVPAPIHAREALAADFNGDGWTDVFFASHGFDTPEGIGELNTLLLSNAEGKLVDSPANIHDVRGFSHSAAVGDIDSDGDIDIYVGNIAFEPNYFLTNDGTGVFTVRKDFIPEDMRLDPAISPANWLSALIVDLDGDDSPELVLGRAEPCWGAPPDVFLDDAILWNDSTGDFANAERTGLPCDGDGLFPLTTDIMAMDIEGDGDKDLIMARTTTNYDSRMIQVLVNNGDRTFTDETSTRIPVQTDDANWVIRLLEIDFNHDGAPDFLLQHDDFIQLGYAELIFINDGSGIFSPLDNSVIANKTGFLFPLDADGDGGLDLIVWGLFNWGDHDFSLLVNETLYPDPCWFDLFLPLVLR
jgi:predicted GH43/DUF377 family glycosyl hydrolase